MSLFPMVLRAMRPSSWMEQQLKMMQQLESAMSSSFPRHPAFHVEWHLPENSEILKHAEAAAKSNQSFKVQMDVKNFAPDEITVKAIDNTVIVEGKHEEKIDGKGFTSRHFIRTYSLPEGHLVEDVVSNLENGVLTVSAPNRNIEEHKVTREIPVEVKENKAGEEDSKK